MGRKKVIPDGRSAVGLNGREAIVGPIQFSARWHLVTATGRHSVTAAGRHSVTAARRHWGSAHNVSTRTSSVSRFGGCRWCLSLEFLNLL